MPDPAPNLPAIAVTALWGVVASLIGGFLIASYTISGITPPYAAPTRPERLTARVVPPDDAWREAGYRTIGLWDTPATDAAAGQAESGSSRL